MFPHADFPQPPLVLQNVLSGASYKDLKTALLSTDPIAICLEDVERMIQHRWVGLLRSFIGRNIPIVIQSPLQHPASPRGTQELILQEAPHVRLHRIDDAARLRLMGIALTHKTPDAAEILLNAHYPMSVDQLLFLMRRISDEQAHSTDLSPFKPLVAQAIRQGNLTQGTTVLTPQQWRDLYPLLLQYPKPGEYLSLLLERGIHPSVSDARLFYKGAFREDGSHLLAILLQYQVPCEKDIFRNLLEHTPDTMIQPVLELIGNDAIIDRQSIALAKETLAGLYGWTMDKAIPLPRRGRLLEILLQKKIPMERYLKVHPDHYENLLLVAVSANQPWLLKNLVADSALYRTTAKRSVDFSTLLLEARSTEMVGVLKALYHRLPSAQRAPSLWSQLVQQVMGTRSSMKCLVPIEGQECPVLSCNMAQLELIKAGEWGAHLPLSDPRLHSFQQIKPWKTIHKREMLVKEQANRLFGQLVETPHTCLDYLYHRREWIQDFVQTVATYQPWMLEASYPGRTPHPMLTHAIQQAGSLYDTYQYDHAPSLLQRLFDCLKTMMGLPLTPPSKLFLTRLEPVISACAAERCVVLSER